MKKIILSIIMCCAISMSFAQEATIHFKNGKNKLIVVVGADERFLQTGVGLFDSRDISYVEFTVWKPEKRYLYTLVNENNINIHFKKIKKEHDVFFGQENYVYNYDDLDLLIYPQLASRQKEFKRVSSRENETFAANESAFYNDNPEISVKSMAVLQGNQSNDQVIAQLNKFRKSRNIGKGLQVVGYSSSLAYLVIPASATIASAVYLAPAVAVGGTALLLSGWIIDATSVRHLRPKKLENK